MHFVDLDAGTGQAIKSVLSQKGLVPTIRVDLRFSGCCDAVLGLRVDNVYDNDLSEEIEGVTFIIDHDIYRITGEITIAYVSKEGGSGYVITSNKPVSEWEGFSATDIKF